MYFNTIGTKATISDTQHLSLHYQLRNLNDQQQLTWYFVLIILCIF